jgi:hypothetical protein
VSPLIKAQNYVMNSDVSQSGLTKLSATRKSCAHTVFQHGATVCLADVNTGRSSITDKAMDFVLTTVSRPALLSSQPPVQWVSRAL